MRRLIVVQANEGMPDALPRTAYHLCFVYMLSQSVQRVWRRCQWTEAMERGGGACDRWGWIDGNIFQKEIQAGGERGNRNCRDQIYEWGRHDLETQPSGMALNQRRRRSQVEDSTVILDISIISRSI